jgi:hypothetical protein
MRSSHSPVALARAELRKCEIKGRTFVLFSLRSDTSAVTVDDPLDNRQTYPNSFKFITAVKPLEGTKEFVPICETRGSHRAVAG